MRKSLVCLAALAILTAGNVLAHEFFVVPHELKEYKAGDIAQIDVLSTHYFMIGEEIEEPADVNQVYVLQGNKKTILKLKANKERLLYESLWKSESNSPALIVGERVGGFYCLTTDGYFDGTKKEAKAAGVTIVKSIYFSKLSKTYLNPSAKDTTFKEPLGQIFEIIPLTNPADISLGKSGKFQLLYDGKPYANAEIFATYDTFDPKRENAFAKSGKSDKNGIVSFTFDHKGLWLVRANYHRASSKEDVDEDDINAIVVFGVK
ncbi:MAG: DUF4198 domain-containing protein [Campylobacteraceae bacterium]|nr:DUF4198 domain-containing protein [Campylobacteraceae bacterium]